MCIRDSLYTVRFPADIRKLYAEAGEIKPGGGAVGYFCYAVQSADGKSGELSYGKRGGYG